MCCRGRRARTSAHRQCLPVVVLGRAVTCTELAVADGHPAPVISALPVVVLGRDVACAVLAVADGDPAPVISVPMMDFFGVPGDEWYNFGKARRSRTFTNERVSCALVSSPRVVLS